jgi:ribonuclease T1
VPRSLAVLVALLLALLLGCGGAVAPTSGPAADPPDGFRGGTIGASQLPAEALATLALIEQGGPYPHDQDGAVFQNREGILPAQARGYYHEYTVETPGSSDRGARRIVTGGVGERYYTDDHYDSFRFVVDP